jgi:hypothetical protein
LFLVIILVMAENTTEIDKPLDPSLEPIYCQFPSRLAITGVLLDCIRQVFSTSNNITHPQLKDFFWAKDQTLDPLKAPYQLVIEDSFYYDVFQGGIRPAITVKPGAWQESKLVIGDNGIGGEQYYKRINGSHSINVIGKTVSQSELLAREVHGYLSHFGPILRQWLGLSRWDAPVLGEPAELEEHSENIIIPISLAYEINYSWELHPQTARLLRQIAIDAIMTNTNIKFQLGA